MKSKPITELTAHYRSGARIRKSLERANIDSPAFDIALTPCRAGNCKGACCSHGFYMEEDEEQDLLEILENKEAELIKIGVKKPAQWITEENHPEFGVLRRIALQPRPFSKMLPQYPKHFPDTACTLLLEDGRCALQVLAVQEGKHKWFYKPILCVLFPVIVDENDVGEINITIYNPDRDPEKKRPEYVGFNNDTMCGHVCALGTKGSIAAKTVVQEELDFLNELGKS